METIKMRCPHCNHIMEEVHTKKDCEYEYFKEPPQRKEHGVSARLTCSKCGKDFYCLASTKENTG